MNKFGTALCLSSALLVSSVAQAQWAYNGLVGVDGGYTWSRGDVDVTLTDPGFFTAENSQRLRNNRGVYGILAGYQARCNGWLLGGELNLDFQNRRRTEALNFATVPIPPGGGVATLVGTASYKREPTLALTGRLGYEVSPYFMPYIRLGAETSRDKLDYDAVETVTGTVLDIEGRRRSYRFIGGVGLEMPISFWNGFSFRVEYDYHSKGRAVVANGIASDGVTLVSASTKQRANTAKAAIVWNFM